MSRLHARRCPVYRWAIAGKEGRMPPCMCVRVAEEEIAREHAEDSDLPWDMPDTTRPVTTTIAHCLECGRDKGWHAEWCPYRKAGAV